VKDFGLNVGGPIGKDRLWFWGAYGGQRIDLLSPSPALTPEQAARIPTYDAREQAQHDKTQLNHFSAKLNAQFGRHMLEGLFLWADKTKQGRDASATRPPETTWNQKGPSWMVKLQDEFFVTDNLFLSLKGARFTSSLSLEPQGGRNVDAWQDAQRVWHGTYYYYQSYRQTWHWNGQAVYYRSQFLGGSHELKIGAEFRRSGMTSEIGFGTGAAYLHRPSPEDPNRHRAVFVFPGLADYWKQRISAYIQDTYTVGRWTLRLGARWDVQTAGYNPVTREAPNEVVARFVAPRMEVPGGGQISTWTTLSPRLGLIYDLGGTGKTLLKGSFSLYPSEFDPGPARVLGTTWRETLYRFTDLNGNHRWDPGEPLVGPVEFCSEPLPPLRPPPCDENLKNLSSVAKSYKSPKTMEFSVGVEHQLIEDLGVALTGFYRRLWDFNWSFPVVPGDIYSCWQPFTAVPGDVRVKGDPNFYTCDLTPTGFLYAHRPDYWQDYKGVELRFTKPMSHRWMLMGSVTLQDWKQHYDSRKAYLDPTNFRQVKDAPMAYQTGGSGKTAVWPNARWMVKLGGVVQLPRDIRLGATLVAREGYIQPNAYIIDTTAWGVCNAFDCGDKTVLLTRLGSERLPTFWMLNARLEKAFRLGNYGRLYISIDGFNIPNNDTALGKYRFVNLAGFGKVTEVVAPRVFRVGARYEY